MSEKKVIIRVAGLEDLRSIKAIDEYIFEEDSYPVFALRQLLDITSGLMKVATLDDEVVGYAIGHHDKGTGEGWLLSAGMLPNHRGRKIGITLLKALVEEMACMNVKIIFLTVKHGNTAGISLYKKLGFETHQTCEDYYLDGLPRRIMKKDLRHTRGQS